MKTFIEIGCADFDTLIPMAEKGGWTGLCVEPIPHHAETLRKRTRHLPVGVIESAVSSFDGHLRMAVGGGEDWARGASHVIGPGHSGAKLLEIEANLRLGLKVDEIEVPCMKLDTLLDEYHIDEIDFMKIDVEGHELDILDIYSWRVKPKTLKIEHKHLLGDNLDLMLVENGYTIFVETDDIYAIL